MDATGAHREFLFNKKLNGINHGDKLVYELHVKRETVC